MTVMHQAEPNAGRWLAPTGELGGARAETTIGGDPQDVSNLTVRENLGKLEHFVWNRVPRAVYERRAEGGEVPDGRHFVTWRLPARNRPMLKGGLVPPAYPLTHGDGDHASGGSYLKEARLWKTQGCNRMAAE